MSETKKTIPQGKRPAHSDNHVTDRQMENPSSKVKDPASGKRPASSEEHKATQGRKVSLSRNLVAMAVIVVILLLLTMWGLRIYTRHGQEIIVPNVKGMKANQAMRKLTLLGLMPIVDDSVYVKTLAPGVIFDQSIRQGNPVKEGRMIHLTVNSGTPPQLTLPDIADNSSLREATVRLKGMGFRLGETEFIHGEKDWVYEVKCDGRNVSAGTRINADKTIVLVVGDGTYFDDSVEEISGNYGDSLSIEETEPILPHDENSPE